MTILDVPETTLICSVSNVSTCSPSAFEKIIFPSSGRTSSKTSSMIGALCVSQSYSPVDSKAEPTLILNPFVSIRRND